MPVLAEQIVIASRPGEPKARDLEARPVELEPETIEAIARRVTEMLRFGVRQQGELIDATELARRLGVQRSWVYAHAVELEAIRLSGGTRPRLRFDPRVVIERMGVAGLRDVESRFPPRPRRTRPADNAAGPSLLPIHGMGAN